MVKKPSLADALASKAPPPPPPAPVETTPAPRTAALTDRRVATTLRIEPEKLEALKIAAARQRVKVNDLILEGVDHVLALHVMKS